MTLDALRDVPAPAKLNLFLHVVGRRSDGYHLLQSVFVLIDWADTLHFARRTDGRLQRHDLGPALPADDLCLRAARALQAASGTRDGVDIAIDKRVPWGAGLGGGSSDAASTLLALNRLWGLQWPRERLLDLAAGLGADVPFFVGGRNAWVEGTGEQLTPIALAPQWFAVVKPPAALATAAIFASPLLRRDSEPATLRAFLESEVGRLQDPEPGESFGRNDLQSVAQAACTELTDVARWLECRFGHSRMTGSGSAFFSRAGMGETPLATFGPKDLPEGWVGRLCRSLEQHPLWGWAD